MSELTTSFHVGSSLLSGDARVKFKSSGYLKMGMKGRIEGHFAGSKAECEQFRQTHSLIPKGTMRVKQGLSGVNRQETIHTQNQSQNIELAWTLKESLGNAVLEGNITELPDVSVVAKMLYTLVYSLHTSYTHLMNNL